MRVLGPSPLLRVLLPAGLRPAHGAAVPGGGVPARARRQPQDRPHHPRPQQAADDYTKALSNYSLVIWRLSKIYIGVTYIAVCYNFHK